MNKIEILRDYSIPFYSAISMGYASFGDTILKFGKNTAISSSSFEDIWYSGGTETLLTSAETVDIVSTSTQDKPSDIGAQSIIIKGLDNNYEIIEEIISLNGTTTVTTTKSFLRIYRVNGYTVGSTGSNVGTVTLTSHTSAVLMAALEPLITQTQKTQFTIPASFYGFMTSTTVSALKNSQFLLDFRIKPYGGVERSGFTIQATEIPQQINFSIPIILAPKSDIKFRAISTSAGSSSISVFYQLFFINKNMIDAVNYRF